MTTALHPIADMFVHKILAGSPIARHLGIVVELADVDHIVMSLPYNESLVTVGTTVHGGVIATLIDVAGAAASGSGITDESTTGGATTVLNVNYIAAANGADLTATADVVHRSRRQTVTDVVVRDSDGGLIATATVTSRIFVA